MHKLHPGAKWQFRFSVYFTLLIPAVMIIGFANSFINISRIAVGSPASEISRGMFLGNIFLSILLAIILIILVGEIYAQMAYNRWKFEFTDTNLKKEKGIIFKKYSNIPYERVQNVEIHRGILARICGFSSVMIHTAGYSGGYGGRYGNISGAEGYLPAVSPEYAEKMRDFLMHKISRKGGSGGL